MKSVFFSFLLLMAALTGYSQISPVQNATIEFNGGTYPGYVAELPSNPNLVESVIKDKLKLQSGKTKNIKGFLVYRGIVLPSIDPQRQIDLFVKIDNKSRKESDASLVYFIPTKAGVIPDDKVKKGAVPLIDPIAGGMRFMDDIRPDVLQKQYEKNILDQQEEVKKADKKLQNLKDEQASLEKKIKQLQDELVQNQKDQSAQQTELDRLKKMLDDIVGRKPGTNP